MTRAGKPTSRIFIFSLVVFGSLSLFTEGKENYPACSAASEKVDYGSGLAIPDVTKARIESYRADWRILCTSKDRSKPTLSAVLAKAKQIEADFKKIIDSFDESILNETNFDARRSEAINDLLSKRFPSFVPAFKGAYGEHEMFSPSIDAFRKSAPLGNAEDRTFFENQLTLEGDFPPYIKKTWDYGGCDQFGEFDWTGILKDLAEVKKKVKSAAYLKESSLFEQGLFRELGTSNDICTCKNKEAVLQDLLTIQKYIRRESQFSAYVPTLQQTIDGIQSGKIKVKSEAETHCSGG